MSNMRIGHDEAIIAHHGTASGCGAPVDRDKLPDRGIVSNGSGSDFTLKFQILRDTRDDCPGEDTYIVADTGTIKNGDIWPNPGIVSDDDIFVYKTKWADRHIGPDFCIGVYRRKVLLVHLQDRLTIWAVRPASETILLPT